MRLDRDGNRVASTRLTAGIDLVASARDGDAILAADPRGRVHLLTSDLRVRWSALMHRGRVTAAEFDPRGARLITGGTDGLARVSLVGSGAEVASLIGHRGSVEGVRFVGAGGHAATFGDDGTARFWEADTGGQVAVLASHGNTVTDIALGQAAGAAITAGLDGSVIAWDASASFPVARRHAHNGAVFGLSPTNRDGWFATSGRDGRVRLWAGATLRPERAVTLAGAVIAVGRYGPDGFAAASRTGEFVALGLGPERRIFDSGIDAFTFSAAADGRIGLIGGSRGGVAVVAPDLPPTITTGSVGHRARVGRVLVWSAPTGPPPGCSGGY